MFDTLSTELANKHLFNNFIKKGILPNPDIMLSKLGKNYEIYREMKNDSHLWSCIQSRKSGTMALEYLIEANGASDQTVNLIERAFSMIDIYKLQSDILESIFFGIQIIEIIWEYKLIDDKYYILPSQLIPRIPDGFAFDEKGGLMIKLKFNETIKAPEYKFIVARNEGSNNNPYGEPVLNKCYWYVTFKNGVTRFWINYAEKYGSPLLLAQFQRGASQEEAEKLADALAEMSQDAVIVTPADFKIDIAESSRSASVELFRELIKYCNNEISKAVLSQTLTTEIDNGSYAAAEIHYKIRKELIKTDSYLASNAINKIIEYTVKLNNEGNNFPKIKYIINEADNNNRIDRDIKLNNAGIKLSKNYWMRTYGLKDEDLEIV